MGEIQNCFLPCAGTLIFPFKTLKGFVFFHNVFDSEEYLDECWEEGETYAILDL